MRDRESGWQKARLHFAFGVAVPGAWEVVVCSPSALDWLAHLAFFYFFPFGVMGRLQLVVT